MDKLKKEIINDYEGWVTTALRSLTDYIGIKRIAVENFKLRLDKLIEYANKIKSGEISDDRDGYSG